MLAITLNYIESDFADADETIAAYRKRMAVPRPSAFRRAFRRLALAS